MGGLLAFLLILIIIVVFILISLFGYILNAVLSFFGFKRRSPASERAAYSETRQTQHSEEKAERMRKFKKTAEDTDYEIVDIEVDIHDLEEEKRE